MASLIFLAQVLHSVGTFGVRQGQVVVLENVDATAMGMNTTNVLHSLPSTPHSRGLK